MDQISACPVVPIASTHLLWFRVLWLRVRVVQLPLKLSSQLYGTEELIFKPSMVDFSMTVRSAFPQCHFYCANPVQPPALPDPVHLLVAQEESMNSDDTANPPHVTPLRRRKARPLTGIHTP